MKVPKDKQIKVKIDTSFSLFKIIERVLVIASIIFIWSLYSNKKAQFKQSQNLITAAQDSLIVWKSKDGKNLAKIAVLETENSQTLQKLESQDTTINELKQLVKRNKKRLKKQGSASIIKSETDINSTTITQVESGEDLKFPIYKGQIQNPWYRISSIATKDSTSYKIKVFSNLNLTIGLESQGLFKKKKPFAIANDENPNTNIKDMRTYQVALPKRRKLGFGGYVGYGATISGGQILVGPQIGGGLNYTF